MSRLERRDPTRRLTPLGSPFQEVHTMARKRSLLVDSLVYLAVRFVVCVLQALPYGWCMRLADGLAWVAYRVDRRHRLVADENLRLAFPGLDDRRRDEVVRAVYRHFIGLVVTLVFLPRRFHPTTWKRYIAFSHPRELLAVMLSGRPLMFVTGHFGNWELGGFLLGVVGFRTWSVARRLDNPLLHRFVESFRGRRGQAILDKSEDYEKILDVLRTGGTLATLGDQDAGPKGLFVDFFGRPASTHKAMAVMALEFRTPVVVMGVAKVGEPMRHCLLLEDIILPEEYDDQPGAVKSMTVRITEAIERLARRHPEQYFWLHRRWKHQPKPRPRRQAA
jgi:KDO2-lipid IV(A) lauroyltransferase